MLQIYSFSCNLGTFSPIIIILSRRIYHKDHSFSHCRPSQSPSFSTAMMTISSFTASTGSCLMESRESLFPINKKHIIRLHLLLILGGESLSSISNKHIICLHLLLITSGESLGNDTKTIKILGSGRMLSRSRNKITNYNEDESKRCSSSSFSTSWKVQNSPKFGRHNRREFQ